jgi:hypothetical protein
MQIILKDVLQSKYKMNTNEFISNLNAKGVGVVFNQASTGYVSGISYSYQGMIITGAKLGNDFKWSSIKNTINYEQEEIPRQFTKQMLDPNQPSISFEQVTNMIREIEQTHSKIMSNTEVYRIQYRTLENLYSGLHSKLESLHKPIENLEERLTMSSAQLSKYQKSSLFQRYWTAAVVGLSRRC